ARRRAAGARRAADGADGAVADHRDESARVCRRSARAAGARESGAGGAQPAVRRRQGAGARRGVEEGDQRRPGRAAGAAAPRDRAARRRLGDRELQGDSAEEHASRPARPRGRRRPRWTRVQREGRFDRRRNGRPVQPAAAGERDRQFREGRAARAGEDRARIRSGSGAPAAAGDVGDGGDLYEVTRKAARQEAGWQEFKAGRLEGGNPTLLPSCLPFLPSHIQPLDSCLPAFLPSCLAMTDDHPHINPWLIAVSVMFATFMEVLDTTVVNVSLPHIAGSLSASIDEATWALTSYLVANAIILPMTGWLASVFGRKRLLMASVTGFTVSSFLCGLAPNLSSLIVFRILQGATGGALQQLSQAVLLEAFPPHERGKALGFWGQGIVVAPILGPVLGGWLTDNYTWRWVLCINIS